MLAALRNAEGLLRLAAGDPDDAIERFADAVELTTRTSDGELRLQAPLNNYANALAAAGRYDEARAALERASALVERNLGPDLAAAHVALGDRVQARAAFERADAIWGVLDDVDPTAAAVTRLGLAELLDDDPDRSRALARVALDAFAAAGPRWTPEVERARTRLAAIGG